MKFTVDVEYDVEKQGIKGKGHDRAVLTDEHATSYHRLPVLVFQGEPLGIADVVTSDGAKVKCLLTYGINRITKIKAVWRQTRTGPVWSLIQKAIDAGYPIEIDPIGE